MKVVEFDTFTLILLYQSESELNHVPDVPRVWVGAGSAHP